MEETTVEDTGLQNRSDLRYRLVQVLSCHACNITSVIKISLNLTGLSTYRNYLKVSADTSLAPGASNDKKGKHYEWRNLIIGCQRWTLPALTLQTAICVTLAQACTCKTFYVIAEIFMHRFKKKSYYFKWSKTLPKITHHFQKDHVLFQHLHEVHP